MFVGWMVSVGSGSDSFVRWIDLSVTFDDGTGS